MQDWKDKVVLITGAGTGIGRALSKELAGKGAVVYVTGLSVEECQPVVDEIAANGFNAFPAKLDVNQSEDWLAVLDQIKQLHGQLDVLVNNAGILYVGEFYDMDESYIEKLVHTNFTALSVGALHCFRIMKEQGHGLILNVSSMGGFSPTPTMAVYAATKHAVLGLTSALDLEGQAFGIRVRAVCFGLIGTEMIDNAEMKKGNASTILDMLPVKPVTPEEATASLVKQLAGNSRVLFVPFYARITWWIYRLFPFMLNRGGMDTINNFRDLMEKDY
jgi:short-subunit dehydrogenase